MTSALDEWTMTLAGVIANALVDFRQNVHDRVVIFAVDCHPWNGVLGLAFLTDAEVEDDPLLSDPAEMAVWKHFDFASGLSSWQHAAELAMQMRAAYEKTAEDRAGIAEGYFRACAVAVASRVVQEALSRYDLRDPFKISVAHPDTGIEFYLEQEQ